MESPKRKSSKRIVGTEELIRLVRERKCLWDRSCPEYRDRQEKERAWIAIYKEVEPDYDSYSNEVRNSIGMQITKKWYNVRDSYKKSRKFHNIRKPYLHSKLLSFLEPIYFKDKSFEDSKCEVRSDNEDNETEEQWFNEVFVVDDEGEVQEEVKRPKLENNEKIDEPTHNETDDNIISVLAKLISKEDDDDRAFFKSIMPAVKTLSNETKLDFRIQVMKLLKNFITKDKFEIKMKHASDDSDAD